MDNTLSAFVDILCIAFWWQCTVIRAFV